MILDIFVFSFPGWTARVIARDKPPAGSGGYYIPGISLFQARSGEKRFFRPRGEGAAAPDRGAKRQVLKKKRKFLKKALENTSVRGYS